MLYLQETQSTLMIVDLTVGHFCCEGAARLRRQWLKSQSVSGRDLLLPLNRIAIHDELNMSDMFL